MQSKKLILTLSALVLAISTFIVIHDNKKTTIALTPTNERLVPDGIKKDHGDWNEQTPQTELEISEIDPLVEETWQSARVRKGDSLSKIFKRLKVPQEELAKLTRANKNIGAIKPGQIIKVGFHSNKVISISLEINEFDTLVFKRNNNSYTFYKEQIEPTIKLETKSSIINSSLFVDAKKVGLETKMIMQLTEIFAWDIDYSQDLRTGDSFTIIYERLYKGEEFISTGRILAAEFKNKNKTYRAALFPLHEKNAEYYSENGSAMRKAFLRTPVDFTRISSRFNLRRKHPILNRIRAHTGVDYAAPVGTPVKSTAKGKVIKRKWDGGYGKTVVIQHGNKYSTLYAHLSSFKRGVSVGSLVKQGQVIGFVGSTGLATGPHLHYEFRVNKKHKNPLKYQYPSAKPIALDLKKSFARQANPLFEFLKSNISRQTTFNEPSFTTVNP
tara:strand:- start:626 stop:1951 length:1326 start_codon:yes stop_codon:yes gene_type:complete